MTRERTPIDRLIEPAVERVVTNSGGAYFRKREVVAEIVAQNRLAQLLADLRSRHGGWKIDQLLLRYIDTRVGQVLQQRDANGIRVYECYAASEKERRWMPLRAMTIAALRAVAQEARTQERQLHLKGEGYQFFIEELERAADTATVDEVYERALPKILAYRARAS